MYQYRIKKIERIIDGDTFICELDLGFNIILKQTVRLIGINTPEIHTLNEEVKKYGLRAKEKLQEYLSKGSEIIIETKKPDSIEKYGRIIGSVYVIGEPLTADEYMIANNYAWSYKGKGEKNLNLSELAALDV
jgi:micrococcal nuclease